MEHENKARSQSSPTLQAHQAFLPREHCGMNLKLIYAGTRSSFVFTQGFAEFASRLEILVSQDIPLPHTWPHMLPAAGLNLNE